MDALKVHGEECWFTVVTGSYKGLELNGKRRSRTGLLAELQQLVAYIPGLEEVTEDILEILKGSIEGVEDWAALMVEGGYSLSGSSNEEGNHKENLASKGNWAGLWWLNRPHCMRRPWQCYNELSYHLEGEEDVQWSRS